MPFGQNKAIAADRIRIGGVELHRVEESSRHKLGGGKAGSRVPRTCLRGHAQRMNAKQASFLTKLFEQRRSGRGLSGCGHGASSCAHGNKARAQRQSSLETMPHRLGASRRLL